ncbi:hypothetical protein [Novosphingobium sp. KN65.2]|uniref:hypothetical protein n=1 Tax=Novosphingobium sp. KN65.2 TaxID=1478134 RepID=UPI000AFDF809|nr:hypothetical protein [Novosphingobium sp. KN65.2]
MLFVLVVDALLLGLGDFRLTLPFDPVLLTRVLDGRQILQGFLLTPPLHPAKAQGGR